MQKLWKGRTDAAVDQLANDFNSSISFDRRMYRQDIDGSIAHATMLGETRIIEKSEADKIVAALQQIKDDIENGALTIDMTSEDIHSFIELTLTARIGDVGKKLHTARSRNDQVALDLRMYLAGECEEIGIMLKSLISTFAALAEEHAETIMPGYTHMQRAQPITFGHYLLAYAAMFLRDLERLNDGKKRLLQLPLGAGALAGTSYPIDRQMVAELLGFEGVSFNSVDAVSDRDFVLESAFIFATVMTHLSRLSVELILYTTWEFKFIKLDDAYSTGSSIMPQKKNADIAELIRGKTGRVYGSLTTLLTMTKGLPLAYNKDMQEDKQAVFDAVDTVKMCLPLMEGMLETMTINKDAMLRAAAKGYLNATDCADYLTKKRLPFRDAYRVTGELVTYAESNGKTLEELTLEEYKAYSDLFEDDIYTTISLEQCVRARSSEGGTSPESVKKQIEIVREKVKHA